MSFDRLPALFEFSLESIHSKLASHFLSFREIQGLFYDSLFRLFSRHAELYHPPRSSLRSLPFPFNCFLQSTRTGYISFLSGTHCNGDGAVYQC